MTIKVGMISLGCSKNQVDAERLLAVLAREGYEICSDMTECDAVIVNTCGFIEDAKKESIEEILELCKLKEEVYSQLTTFHLESTVLTTTRRRLFSSYLRTVGSNTLLT